MNGWEHMVQVQQALRKPGLEPQDQLAGGAIKFISAVLHMETWPEELQELAQTVLRNLLKHGTVHQTIMKMDDETAMRSIEELAQFAEEFQRFYQTSLNQYFSLGPGPIGHDLLSPVATLID